MPSKAPAAKIIAATCVAMPGKSGGVLLLGKSGSGKSDLALRLIEQHGCKLVSDDQVVLTRKARSLSACAPAALVGLLEIRGVGILRMPVKSSTRIALAVALVPGPLDAERLPKPEHLAFLGVSVPVIKLHAFEASAGSKLVAALRALQENTMEVGAFRE